MATILCFGDSNTWGFDPDASAASPFAIRHPPAVRWTGVLASSLGEGHTVIAEGQNGRTTVHDDPFFPARNGSAVLPSILESHKPIDVVVLMLGTNDLKAVYNVPPGEVAAGAGVLAKTILRSDFGPAASPPRVLLVCPPTIGPLAGFPELTDKFPDGEGRSRQLQPFYRKVANELRCGFLDAQPLMTSSPADPLHFAAQSHAALGLAVAGAVQALMASPATRLRATNEGAP